MGPPRGAGPRSCSTRPSSSGMEAVGASCTALRSAISSASRGWAARPTSHTAPCSTSKSRASWAGSACWASSTTIRCSDSASSAGGRPVARVTRTCRSSNATSSARRLRSAPRTKTSSTDSSSARASRRINAVARVWTTVRSMAPSASATWASEAPGPQADITWSRSESASRIPPSACRTMRARAASESPAFSSVAICFSRASIRSTGMRRKSCRWQRERMVSGSLWGSVVAKMNFTCPGGSSSVFSRALKAAPESMCTSSMM